MPAIELVRSFETGTQSADNPLPRLLHTPLGLAIIEIQGTIHTPNTDVVPADDEVEGITRTTRVGRLEFPSYDGSGGEGPWMKSVHLYIGKHQRLTGEVKKLAKPLMVLSKVDHAGQSATSDGENQLGIHAIIRHKILFSGRPEPVGG